MSFDLKGIKCFPLVVDLVYYGRTILRFPFLFSYFSGYIYMFCLQQNKKHLRNIFFFFVTCPLPVESSDSLW